MHDFNNPLCEQHFILNIHNIGSSIKHFSGVVIRASVFHLGVRGFDSRYRLM
jgi:hypothetical protein